MENAPAPTEATNALPKGCLPGLHPQRQRFDFDEISIDTLFDSANLANATKYKNFHYHLTIAPDGYLTSAQTTNKTWFYFRITNIQKRGKYTFTITNMNRQNKLYETGLLPAYRAIPSSPEWKTIAQQTILMRSVDKDLEVTFNHELNSQDQEVYLAFTYPWSYTDDQEMINQYEVQFKDDQEIYFHRELLTNSRENRKIELITISSHLNKTDQREQLLPNLFPSNTDVPRPFKFENKKYVFISARVHPGETPASYTFRGLIRFLLDKNDSRSNAFRDNFVICLVPMLNPDGVSRGHYRMDTHGLNLNRFYIKPTSENHPSIYAVKQVVLDLHNQGKLFLYCDLHAHANVKGIFTYGNNMNFRDQVEGRLFPKLLSLNSQYFEYSRCDFSETNTGQEQAEGKGKDRDGAGRVALYKDTNNPKCYTLECNYSSGKIRNIIQSLPESERRLEVDDGSNMDINPADIKDETIECLDPYTYQCFEEVGEAIGPSLLDMIGQNPLSRLAQGPYKNVTNVKLNIGLALMKDLKFRFDPFLRKISGDVQSNLEVLQKYIDEGVQLEPISKPKKEPASKLKKKVPATKKPKDAQKEAVNEEAEKTESLNDLAPKAENPIDVNSEANEA